MAKAIVVVGAQWGDEGKGKVVDYLAGGFDYTARFAGGHNAGHTVIHGDKRFVLQLIPCGILRPGKHAVIGSGTVVDPTALLGEIETLQAAGLDVNGRLHLSNRAHLIFPFHRQMDKAAEASRGAGKIGTTARGIGPAYEDKMARHGVRVCDLMDADVFRTRLERVIVEKNAVCRAAYGAELEVGGSARRIAAAGGASASSRDGHGDAAESRAGGRPLGFIRGRAGNDARYRSRNVSVRDVIQRDFGRRDHGLRRGSYEN